MLVKLMFKCGVFLWDIGIGLGLVGIEWMCSVCDVIVIGIEFKVE